MDKTIKCDVYGFKFTERVMTECRNPAVVKRYGHDGKANVCIYICAKCKYSIKHPSIFSFVCGYEDEANGK